MKFGEMLDWTNRLNEVRKIKDNRIKKERMRNLNNDFKEVYGAELVRTSDQQLLEMHTTLKEEFSLV